MEESILLAFQSVRVDGVVQLAALISALGNTALLWIIVAVVMLFMHDKFNTGVVVLLSMLVTGILVELVISPAAGRIRPCDADIGIIAVTGVGQAGYSFPSFHAASSFAAATAIALSRSKRGGTIAFIMAILIAVSRLYLGVNYPTDVLAGAVLGVVIGVVMMWLYNQFLLGLFRNLGGGTGYGARRSINSGESSASRTSTRSGATMRKSAGATRQSATRRTSAGKHTKQR